MESAKEKAIREAYGEHWEKFNESAKKCALKNEGYISNLLEHTPNNIDLEQGDRMFRPKSLHGIETNLGWSLFEGSDTLPTKECNYILGKFVRGAFRYIEGSNLMQAKHALVSMQYTHYREQENYPTPIY